jgi:hypothetical protein
MKRSPLSVGAKSLERGSTFASRGTGLTSRPPARKPRTVSPASPEQRAKAFYCIVTGARRDEGWTVDPAHLASRAHGGCDSALCVVGLRRDVHELFDRGEYDLLPHLLGHLLVPEILHALEHYRGDLLGLAARLSGERAFVPARPERAT